MKTDATNSRLGDLLVDIKNEKLIPQPDFQRRLVWSNKDKVNFIRTVLQDYPFPEIYIAYGNVNPDTSLEESYSKTNTALFLRVRKMRTA